MRDSQVIVIGGGSDNDMANQEMEAILDDEIKSYQEKILDMDALIALYFSYNTETDKGVTLAMVQRMSPYRRFILLHEIYFDEYGRRLGDDFFAMLFLFVTENEAGWFKSSLDSIEGKITVLCRCGKEFFVWHENEQLPNHDDGGGSYCIFSHRKGICIVCR